MTEILKGIESLRDSPQLMLGVAVAVLLAIVLLMLYLRWRSSAGHRFKRVLGAIAIDTLTNIVIPDGMDGHIHIEYLLLTRRGILVLDVKDVAGAIFGSDKMDEWAVIDGRRRFGFRNPQGPLYDRVAAVRLITRDVPVDGRVVFMPSGEFTKGVPSHVAMLDELLHEFRKPEKSELDKVVAAFYPHWEQVKAQATDT